MLQDLDLVLVGELLEDVGEPLVVERGDHGGTPLGRQVVDHAGGVGGAHLVQGRDQVGGALRRLRATRPTTSRHSTTWVWPGSHQPTQGATHLIAALDRCDTAIVIGEPAHGASCGMVAALDDERLADVLEELPDEDQVEIMGYLGSERAAACWRRCRRRRAT